MSESPRRPSAIHRCLSFYSTPKSFYFKHSNAWTGNFAKKYKLMEKIIDYVSPQCDEMELTLEGAVLNASVPDYGDGGEL